MKLILVLNKSQKVTVGFPHAALLNLSYSHILLLRRFFSDMLYFCCTSLSINFSRTKKIIFPNCHFLFGLLQHFAKSVISLQFLKSSIFTLFAALLLALTT